MEDFFFLVMWLGTVGSIVELMFIVEFFSWMGHGGETGWVIDGLGHRPWTGLGHGGTPNHRRPEFCREGGPRWGGPFSRPRCAVSTSWV